MKTFKGWFQNSYHSFDAYLSADVLWQAYEAEVAKAEEKSDSDDDEEDDDDSEAGDAADKDASVADDEGD